MRLRKFLGHTDGFRFPPWSLNGDYVASTSDDGTIRVWKVGDRDEQKPQILEQGDCFATGVSFSPGGKYIATCGTNGKIMVWAPQQDESGWNLQHTFEGHRDYVLSVLISPDSKQILSSGADKTIRIWDMDSGDDVNKDSPINTKLRIYKMWLDKHSSSHVMTPYGAKSPVSASSGPSQLPSWSPYWISYNKDGDEAWVIWRGKKVIFLPKQFGPSACGVFGHRVVVCTDFGQVGVYGFSEAVTADTRC
ncbi:Vegetative incompatibility protein HET-E-1 [Metarhizium brunneum]|uniref:Vegetative incompatibility protein HET-E-1 n=1 Tax=Metarhizium brunneum TaxID=500148 RepID=A0A7D5ZEH4_9HYPO|nr:Vegetative incompatibility protein HET-E-1 [Metarhizium brunneum]